jgi:hypothetical protein
MPNVTALDMSLPEVATLVAAMVQARDAVSRRSWSHPQEPTGEEWWADVLADPRARKRERRADLAAKQAFYRLADEKREIITCRVQQVRLAGCVFARSLVLSLACGSIHSISLSALAKDRAMEAWYHPSIARMTPNRRVTWQATSDDENS